MSAGTVRDTLVGLADPEYRDFVCRLVPTVPPENILGVRTPALREVARQLKGTPDADAFLAQLPHRYYDEYNLHASLISYLRDPGALLKALDAFLPYVDNWATCDMLSPKLFAKRPPELLPAIRRWLTSDEPYTVRFGINMLMGHYLGEGFDPAHLAWVAALRSEHYYIRMGAAWYFATALAKQPEATLTYITERRLEPWVHNKSIQKAIESRRISDEMKATLRALKVPLK